jgi:DNA-binding transcriptional regulator YiaG
MREKQIGRKQRRRRPAPGRRARLSEIPDERRVHDLRATFVSMGAIDPRADRGGDGLGQSELRRRIIEGALQPGDVAALRGFVRLTQAEFAAALGISRRTLQNWEQDRTTPNGSGLALLRIAARHPAVMREAAT